MINNFKNINIFNNYKILKKLIKKTKILKFKIFKFIKKWKKFTKILKFNLMILMFNIFLHIVFIEYTTISMLIQLILNLKMVKIIFTTLYKK